MGKNNGLRRKFIQMPMLSQLFYERLKLLKDIIAVIETFVQLNISVVCFVLLQFAFETTSTL